MTEHPLYLGLDLSPEYTQLSYYKLDEGVPESICHSDSKDTYLLPNIMFYTDKYKDGTGAKDESGWSVGAVAAGKRFKEDGVMVDRIYQKTIINEDTEIYGTSYKSKRPSGQKCCCFISGNLQNSLKAMRSGGW